MIRLAACALLALSPVTALAVSASPKPAVEDAVNRSVRLMQASLTEYPKHVTCFACHHQGVGVFALAQARAHGYSVDGKVLEAAVQHTKADLRSALENYRKGQGQPGAVTRAGYALLAISYGGARQDELTGAVAGYLLQRDKDVGYWRCTANRPPQEASSVTDTFLAIRAIKAYASPGPDSAARIDKARQWLEQVSPKDTEDRVFRLWGMQEAGGAKETVVRAGRDLLSEQRSDGGWAQLPGSASDAYATGSALTVLRLTDQLREDSAQYRRGVDYLLKTQQPDGSWHVVSRSKPFQPYFESGFPHGKDQFISMAATGWATAALALAKPEKAIAKNAYTVDKLGGIAGHWSMENKGRTIEENWTRATLPHLLRASGIRCPPASLSSAGANSSM